MKLFSKAKQFYKQQYKRLLFFPFALVLLSFVILFVQYANTGDFFIKDVSLKGGVTITVTEPPSLSLAEIEHTLQQTYSDLSVRSLNEGFVIEAGLSEKKDIDALIALLSSFTAVSLTEDQYTVQLIGATLSESFLRQSFIAMLFSFLVMMLIVLLYFRSLLPSFFIVWTVFIDIVGTFAVLNIIGEALSVAGLAAFLMLIGYSVDTDILLTSKVLKSKSGTIFERVCTSMRTGLTMTVTALLAVIVGLFLAQSDTVRQIMLVLVIGISLDVIHTWLTNASILRWWAEKNHE